ncbi:MAG: outer rane lipoprotein carrier protein, partial [Pseudomonadota bacterium]|nr:outer rane lipoprotein carrier protein [Pseudomonadota bacterium]
MKKLLLRWIGALLFCAVVPGGVAQAAEDSLARVEAYLGSLKTLAADFAQVVRNRDGDIVERASGTLSLSRPNRFRWDYREPYQQTIVADGTRLWL